MSTPRASGIKAALFPISIQKAYYLITVFQQADQPRPFVSTLTEFRKEYGDDSSTCAHTYLTANAQQSVKAHMLTEYRGFAEACNASGTQGRTRTGTPAKAGDFESPASTIPPLGHCGFFSAALCQRPDQKVTSAKEFALHST